MALGEATIIYYKEALDKKFHDIIKQQINVKEIKFLLGDPQGGSDLRVELDTHQTPDLEAEGYARELSRQIQDFRKNLGLQKKDYIELYIITNKEFVKTLETQENFIKERTNSKKIGIITENSPEHIKVKERFKNKIAFSVKDKRGEIAIIVTDR